MAEIAASYLLLILLFLATAASKDVDAIEGICKTLVENKGYACQEHQVTTQDGYILTMLRIPKGHSGEGPDKPPVLLQHGLIMDGIIWLLSNPDQSLAFVLADNGFDVWIANNRGTRYSRGHTSLSPDEPIYWEWSWDELAAYDLPATFEYVRGQTGQKLHYVGHSLGTLIALAAFSQGKLVSMLRSAALLSPIAYLNQISSLFARTLLDIFLAHEELSLLGVHEFDPRGVAVIELLEIACNVPGIDCSNLATPIAGQNCCLNSSITEVFLEHEPQSTATKNMAHLAQMVRNGNIAMFDYDDEEINMEHYGQPSPPEYDMKNIPKELPLFLSNGGQDTLSDINDVQVLLDCLKDHDGDKKLVVQFIEDYAHFDFVFAVNANQLVFDPVMAFFKLH